MGVGFKYLQTGRTGVQDLGEGEGGKGRRGALELSKREEGRPKNQKKGGGGKRHGCSAPHRTTTANQAGGLRTESQTSYLGASHVLSLVPNDKR